jgi:hypothetical protein
MVSDSLERLIALVRRELGAENVRVLGARDQTAEAENVLYADLPDGRHLAVAFASAPPAKEALLRRLAILTSTFAQSLELGGRGPSRPVPARSLQEELRAVAAKAHAVDAAVIDAHSPVVWGAASAAPESLPPDALPLVELSRARLTAPQAPLSSESAVANAITDDDDDSEPLPPAERARDLTERALAAVRALPGLGALRKGGHVAHTVRDKDLGVFVRSFASIYLLVLVYEATFNELRAERAVEDALPRIERLVLALPPLDPKPAPIAGVMAMRRGKKR